MQDLEVDLFWMSLAGLVVVVGPWKAGIVYAESTIHLKARTRRLTAFYTVGIATVVGTLFILVGAPLLDFFHIDQAAFLIGAGLIVIVFSIGMVISDSDHSLEPDPDATPETRALNLAIYPLSVPLVITPPGIASLVALGVIATSNEEKLLPVGSAFLVVMLINLGVFLIESRFEHKINPAVFHVAGRLLGVLLVAFGVSIVIDGLKELDLLH
ncbi:MAG: MarC family protein [Acidimicrobiales bacterium]